ncbi:cyclic peptide export ABC transporter (plasmid) [Pseudoalteromonas sp. T1lg65]|uniref:cyclic peptide export ABC transporter n=1 Tax=Pseudoalteromonas sp. T1lg65 TaxID=2077101 RepID=UPI003F798116
MIYSLYKRHSLRIFVATLLSIVCALASVGIISLIDSEISNMSGKEEATSSLSMLGQLLEPFVSLQPYQIFIAAILVVFFLGIFSQYLLARLSNGVVYDLRKTMVRRILGTPYEQIEKVGGHRVYATITDDVNSISEGLMLLPVVVYNATLILLYLVYMFISSWQLSLVVIGGLVALMLVAAVMIMFGTKYQKIERNNEDDLFAGFKGLVDGGKELNVNSSRKWFFYNKNLLPTFEAIRQINTTVTMIYVTLSKWVDCLLFCIMAIILFGAQHFIENIALSTIVSFMLIVLLLMPPLAALASSLGSVGKLFVAYKKLNSLELSEPDNFIQSKKESSEEFKDWKSLYISGISYQYPLKENEEYGFGIGPIDLKINRGDLVFLTGGNGSGKTTFAKILCGLYTQNEGTIKVDEKEISPDINKESYCDLFSTIFSDFYLFDQTLDKDGNPGRDDVIEQYIDKLRLNEKVSSKDGVLTTTDLSQGQKKRLALLLTYIEDSSILLFDEWAADQDPYFRDFFYTSLLSDLKEQGKTVIVISHDDRYFHLADRRFNFEQGMIVSPQDFEPTTVNKSDGQSFEPLKS